MYAPPHTPTPPLHTRQTGDKMLQHVHAFTCTTLPTCTARTRQRTGDDTHAFHIVHARLPHQFTYPHSRRPSTGISAPQRQQLRHAVTLGSR
eukprot:118565-Chlamydomonas_euryale.AAC.8